MRRVSRLRLTLIKSRLDCPGRVIGLSDCLTMQQETLIDKRGQDCYATSARRSEIPGIASVKRPRRMRLCIFWMHLFWAGLSACASAPIAPITQAPLEPGQHRLYVVNHGWHTGIVVRAADVPAHAWPARRDFPDAQYLEVGWGSHDYYQAKDPGVWLALKSAFLPGASVLHVVAFDGAVERYFSASEVLEIRVSGHGLKRFIEHVRASHAIDPAGQPLVLGTGLYGRSRFYASKETFHLLNNCNVWVATALGEAGVPLPSTPTIRAGALMFHVRTMSPVQTIPPVNSETPSRP